MSGEILVALVAFVVFCVLNWLMLREHRKLLASTTELARLTRAVSRMQRQEERKAERSSTETETSHAR